MPMSPSSPQILSQLEKFGSIPIPTSRGTDPLASKVTSILSTSYSDGEFREALELLDNRGIVNDARTRRWLRLDLQKEVIDCNGEIIAEFGRVAQRLGLIKATIENINDTFEAMKGQLTSAQAQNFPILLEASSLMAQRKEVEEKQKVLAAFKNHFIMLDDEIAVLTSAMGPIDDHFFDCLQKAKKIRQDCQLLLGIGEQTLGLELMDQTLKNINLGFQKLYQWVQREFKTLNLENPQMNPSIRRALRVLAERPSLFQNCLDFFADTRERVLSESFHCALTGTAPSGVEDPTLKPIDLTAHDPLRYVGDMLAWIHSATASEHEALEVLFVAEGDELAKGLQTGRDAEVWRLVAEEGDDLAGFNATKALNELVDRDISGAIRVLRQKMEQIIQANEDVVTAYKVASLLSFYHVAFERLLGSQSGLLQCVNNLESEAMRQFRGLIRDQIAALQSEFQQAPAHLEPPVFLQVSFRQLKAIIRTYEASLSNTETNETAIHTILSEAFEPFMNGCDAMSQSMTSPEDVIFRINYRLAAAGCLGEFESARQKTIKLREGISTDRATLVDSQYQFLRESSGLNSVMESFDDGGLSNVDKETLGQAGQHLDDFLPSALMDALERLKCLQKSDLAREITEEAVDRFCRDFEQLEVAIMEVEHNAEEPDWRLSFPRTTAELRVLLS